MMRFSEPEPVLAASGIIGRAPSDWQAFPKGPNVDKTARMTSYGSIHRMQERHFKEAFSALSEAVKFKRESWQTWSNYAHAAVQTQNHLQAARGILQVT